MENFELASRKKVRFDYKGLCSVEDLWDIPIKALDEIFKKLNAQAKAQKEESLLSDRTPENEVLALQIDLVKHVVGVRLKEKQDRESAAQNSAKKQKLLEILANKEDQALHNMSPEDLKTMIQQL